MSGPSIKRYPGDPMVEPNPPTFVCKDCGAEVYDALGEARERCYPCQWVANVPEEAAREQIRAWLIEVGAIDEAPKAAQDRG
jgi:hypothetical protein